MSGNNLWPEVIKTPKYGDLLERVVPSNVEHMVYEVVTLECDCSMERLTYDDMKILKLETTPEEAR